MRHRLLMLLFVVAASTEAYALDYVTFRHDGKEQTVAGREVVTAADGGILLLAADGTLWTIEPANLISRGKDERAFRPLPREEMSKQLLSELPPGFEIHSTKHYLIAYNTSREYANWCGALFERLHLAFTNYWTRKGLKLREPELPLVAVVFGSRDSYVNYAQAELSKLADSVVGYYSLRSNRMTMYDLTGVEAVRQAGQRRATATDINYLLDRPEAAALVATIIHEATHQIAYNTGMQTRFADIPLWVSEGLAVYFETPDLESERGWRTIGAVNYNRLERFREYLPNRGKTSLQALIADDKRMRDGRLALDAYAEAWALNYFLINQRPKQYLAYLTKLSQKKELIWDDPETRVQEFQAAFGENLGQLDAEFLRQMQKLH